MVQTRVRLSFLSFIHICSATILLLDSPSCHASSSGNRTSDELLQRRIDIQHCTTVGPCHLYLLRCLAKKTTYVLGELVMASSMLVLHGHFEAVYLLQIIKNSRYRRKQFNFELFRPEVAVHKHQIFPS